MRRTDLVAMPSVVAAVLLLCGCSSSSSGASATAKRDATHTGLDANLPRGAPQPSAARDCASSGQHGLTRQSLQQSLVVGPIRLGGLGAELRGTGLPQTRSVHGGYPVLEAIATLKAGATVVLAVPRAERRYVALVYDKSKFRDDGLYRLRSLDSAVRFEACRDPAFNHGISQFDGGIVLARRRCFSLDFWVAGDKRRITRRLPLGAHC
jgi:hypothetical protein